MTTEAQDHDRDQGISPLQALAGEAAKWPVRVYVFSEGAAHQAANFDGPDRPLTWTRVGGESPDLVSVDEAAALEHLVTHWTYERLTAGRLAALNEMHQEIIDEAEGEDAESERPVRPTAIIQDSNRHRERFLRGEPSRFWPCWARAPPGPDC